MLYSGGIKYNTGTQTPARRLFIKQSAQGLKLSNAPTLGPSIEQTSLNIGADVPSSNVFNNAVPMPSNISSSTSPSSGAPMQFNDTPSVGHIINATLWSSIEQTSLDIVADASSSNVFNNAVPSNISSFMSPSPGAPMWQSHTPSIVPTVNASLLQIKTDVSSTNVQNSTMSKPSTASLSTEDMLFGYLFTILPKISALLSMVGSSMVVISVANSKKNRHDLQQRIIGAMCCFDFMVSMTWLLTPFYIPSSFKEKGFPLALGNELSCNIQGFLIQLSTASFLYNASLSVYYVLIIKHNWPMDKMRKIAKLLHIIPISFGLITAIISVSIGVVGDADWDCWIEPQYSKYQWGLFFGPLCLSLGITIFNMAQVYRFVKNAEDKAAKYRRNSRYSRTHKNTQSIAKQNKLYVTSFLITWLLPTIVRLIQIGKNIIIPTWFILLSGTVIPFQGFFNALVYFRLRFNRCSKDNEDKHWTWVIYRIILKIYIPCLYHDNNINNNNNNCGRDDGKDLEPAIIDPILPVTAVPYAVPSDDAVLPVDDAEASVDDAIESTADFSIDDGMAKHEVAPSDDDEVASADVAVTSPKENSVDDSVSADDGIAKYSADDTVISIDDPVTSADDGSIGDAVSVDNGVAKHDGVPSADDAVAPVDDDDSSVDDAVMSVDADVTADDGMAIHEVAPSADDAVTSANDESVDDAVSADEGMVIYSAYETVASVTSADDGSADDAVSVGNGMAKHEGFPSADDTVAPADDIAASVDDVVISVDDAVSADDRMAKHEVSPSSYDEFACADDAVTSANYKSTDDAVTADDGIAKYSADDTVAYADDAVTSANDESIGDAVSVGNGVAKHEGALSADDTVPPAGDADASVDDAVISVDDAVSADDGMAKNEVAPSADEEVASADDVFSVDDGIAKP